MDLKKLFTLAAVPALVFSLSACDGKKEPPKPAASSDAAASAPAAADSDAPRQVSEDVKKVVGNEYKDFDEKNQCWVVKNGADNYCLAPISSSKYTLSRDNNKTRSRFNYVILESKGKLVNGELNEKSDGGISMIATDKDGQVVAKLPFTKEWRSPQNDCDSHLKDGTNRTLPEWRSLKDVCDSHFVMNRVLGNGVAGAAVSETVTIASPVGKSGEHRDNLRSAAYRVTKLYAFDGSSIRPVMKVRTKFIDSKIPYYVFTSAMSGPVDPDTGYATQTFKLVAEQKAEAFNGKTFEAKYNPARKQYDIPAELRKIMKE